MTLNICRLFCQDCPNGRLEKSKVHQMYTMILPEGNASVVVEQMFRLFDKDENGWIDFKAYYI